MAYDEKLAGRVREALAHLTPAREQRMFGGLAFMVRGHMCCGVTEDLVVLRLGREEATRALAHTYMREMDFTGKPLKSMVYLTREGHRRSATLRRWIERAVAFTHTLPAKKRKRTATG